jgi:hypothetical protein
VFLWEGTEGNWGLCDYRFSPIGFRHANVVRSLTYFFVEHAHRYRVDPQNPFNLDDNDRDSVLLPAT